MKICSKCKENKELDLFNKNKRKKDGFSTECKACVNKYNLEYRNNLENKKNAKEYNAIYVIEKAEQIAATKKEYAATHKEEVDIIKKRHYENNKEAYKARVAKYKKDNPLQYKEYEYRRRALKKTTMVEKITIEDVINKYGNHCFYCFGSFEELDHYVPLSKNGPHILDNVRPSCKKCNLSKSNKLPEIWLKEKRNVK